ncbi:hypothetical protein FMM05_16000 [Flavobacterium zepuense]|uniref:Uncharacterized protein n=1 Tax=Flavobacterium zepuense TaxID=2593302 RepID=A0A552UX21_9FLAO|nr:hypothetical protein [Flavobacterium zepuense]TRW22759.1 hypothetical protein FMM05_16000 [Flavobacterium zepuense]
MKKIFTVALIALLIHTANAQAPVAMQHLELKKATSSHEIFAAKETQNKGLTIFAADKNRLTALHYNAAVFFKDSLSTTRPDKEYAFMAGYSYNASGQPQVYWVNDDFTKIQSLGFDFSNNAVSGSVLQLPLKDETVLSTFSENNSFFILALQDEQENKKERDDFLKLYVFNDGKYMQKVLDFADFTFKDSDNKETTLVELIEEYGIQKIDVPDFTALPVTASKIKMYVLNDRIVITLDHLPAFTQVITIATPTYAITERIVPQPALDKAGKSVSFYSADRLYQLKLNEEALELTATDLATGKLIKSHTATDKDSITFKNSPLLVQTGEKGGGTLKNTSKFLTRASWGEAALSVYKTPDDIMVVAGGVRSILSTGDILMGVALTSASVVSGGYGAGGIGSFMDPSRTQSVYFEGLFDENFEHRPYNEEQLAIDKISRFISNNSRSVSLQTVIRFNDYYLLGFYDEKAKLYVLLQFEDDSAY